MKIRTYLPCSNSLVDLKAIQCMSTQRALEKIALMKPTDVFTREELGSKILVEQAGKELSSCWRKIATGMARSDIENAIVLKIEELCQQASIKVGGPLVKLSKDDGFGASLGKLLDTIQIDTKTAEEMTAAQQKAYAEGLEVLMNIMSLHTQGQTAQAVTLAQLYLVKLLEELKDVIEEFRNLKTKAIEALDGPAALEMLTHGEKSREPEARDTLMRIKAIVNEIFDGSDFDKKAAIVKAVTTMVVLANDVEFKNGHASLTGATFIKQALDANLELERQYDLGFINPESSLLDEHFATEENIVQLYSRLDSSSQRNFNCFLIEYTGFRLFGLQDARQINPSIVDAIGGLRGFATVCTLHELEFFKRPKADILAVCQTLPLSHLNLMTRNEMEAAVSNLPRTANAADAFRNAQKVS